MTKKALNEKEYALLPQELQIDILHRDGAFVGKIIINGQTRILFQLYGFYVEVQYQLYRKEINRIVVSENIELLIPYLDQVKIRDVDENKSKGPEK